MRRLTGAGPTRAAALLDLAQRVTAAGRDPDLDSLNTATIAADATGHVALYAVEVDTYPPEPDEAPGRPCACGETTLPPHVPLLRRDGTVHRDAPCYVEESRP